MISISHLSSEFFWITFFALEYLMPKQDVLRMLEFFRILNEINKPASLHTESLPYDILIPWPTDLKLTHSGKLDVCVTLGKLIQPVTWSLSFSFTSLGLGHRPSGKCWKWASFVVRTFQSIFGCQKLFCYYTLFFKFAVAVHEQTAAIIHGIKCDGRQSTKMMFRLLFFTGFPRLKKIGNCNNSRCREYIIVNRLRFALRLICKKISQPIETLQRGSLAQSLTWFNVNQETSEYFMTLSSIVQLSHELTSNSHIIARPSAGFPAIIMVPPISSNQLCNMPHLHRLVSHFVVGRLSAVGVAKTNI